MFGSNRVSEEAKPDASSTYCCPRPALLLLLLLVPATLGSQDLKELARQASASVVVLKAVDSRGYTRSSGSGFFVNADGWIVTNFHVIAEARGIEAILANEESVEVYGIVATDESNDLAILQVQPGRFPPLHLSARSTIETGERIVVLGGPLGLAGTLSEGIVSSIRSDLELGGGGRSNPLLQITAPISPGSSGSPVMNHDGEVIGVAVGQLLVGQNLNFAVPVSAVRTLLESVEAGQAPQPLATRATIDNLGPLKYARNLFISILFFTAVALGFRYLKRRG